MRSRSKNTGYVCLVNRKFILGAILLSVILYALVGTIGFELAKAETDSLKAMPGHTEHSLQMYGDEAASWDVILMRVTA